MGSQGLQGNTVENNVKGFAEAQVDNIHSFSLFYLEGHLVTEKLQLAIITMRQNPSNISIYLYCNKWDQHLKKWKYSEYDKANSKSWNI